VFSVSPSRVSRLPRLTMAATPHSDTTTPAASRRLRRLPKNTKAKAMVAIGMKELSSVALVAVVCCSAR